MFRADYHVHTECSFDSEAPINAVIERAIALGLKEIAVTDHVDFDPRYYITDYNKYIPIIEALKEKYSDKINILTAVELGLESRMSDKLNKFMADFPFDFVIGSSHGVGMLDVYYDRTRLFEGRTKKEAYGIYFEELYKNILTCFGFNVYGHIDYISRYGMYDDNSVKYSEFGDYIDECLKALIDRGLGIEINTSGFRYGIEATYPSVDILKRYKELGGEILTCGSDSHRVEDVGDHIDYAYHLASESGFRYITVFRQRKPEFIGID